MNNFSLERSIKFLVLHHILNRNVNQPIENVSFENKIVSSRMDNPLDFQNGVDTFMRVRINQYNDQKLKFFFNFLKPGTSPNKISNSPQKAKKSSFQSIKIPNSCKFRNYLFYDVWNKSKDTIKTIYPKVMLRYVSCPKSGSLSKIFLLSISASIKSHYPENTHLILNSFELCGWENYEDLTNALTQKIPIDDSIFYNLIEGFNLKMYLIQRKVVLLKNQVFASSSDVKTNPRNSGNVVIHLREYIQADKLSKKRKNRSRSSDSVDSSKKLADESPNDLYKLKHDKNLTILVLKPNEEHCWTIVDSVTVRGRHFLFVHLEMYHGIDYLMYSYDLLSEHVSDSDYEHHMDRLIHLKKIIPQKEGELKVDMSAREYKSLDSVIEQFELERREYSNCSMI